MKKTKKTNNKTKNYNQRVFFDVFEFKSTIQKCDFHRINNNFEN